MSPTVKGLPLGFQDWSRAADTSPWTLVSIWHMLRHMLIRISHEHRTPRKTIQEWPKSSRPHPARI